jgi:hypothetical protein
MPTQREWEALFRAAFRVAAAEGAEVTEISAGDVRVTLRLRGLAREAESYVDKWKAGKPARGKASHAA